jgi:hypothetical protein
VKEAAEDIRQEGGGTSGERAAEGARKALSEGTVSGVVPCEHEVDEKEFPEWNPKFGKLYTCIKCGEKVAKVSYWKPYPGGRVHRSKKERRKLKREGM